MNQEDFLTGSLPPDAEKILRDNWVEIMKLQKIIEAGFGSTTTSSRIRKVTQGPDRYVSPSPVGSRFEHDQLESDLFKEGLKLVRDNKEKRDAK